MHRTTLRGQINPAIGVHHARNSSDPDQQLSFAGGLSWFIPGHQKDSKIGRRPPPSAPATGHLPALFADSCRGVLADAGRLCPSALTVRNRCSALAALTADYGGRAETKRSAATQNVGILGYNGATPIASGRLPQRRAVVGRAPVPSPHHECGMNEGACRRAIMAGSQDKEEMLHDVADPCVRAR